MKTIEETLAFIAERIGYIYHHRPIMYGGTGEGVYILLDAYHDLWAEIVDRQADYRHIRQKVNKQDGAGAHNFASRYQAKYPRATQDEIAAHVVKCYRRISDLLGVDIPHERIIQELANDCKRDGTDGT